MEGFTLLTPKRAFVTQNTFLKSFTGKNESVSAKNMMAENQAVSTKNMTEHTTMCECQKHLIYMYNNHHAIKKY